MKNTAYNLDASHHASNIQRSQAYATPQDFCAIFRDEMDGLYSLALSLTGSHEAAHKTFLAALNDCRTGNAVFAEWAHSWSRRAVIKSAIRLLAPVRSRANDAPEAGPEAIASGVNPSARPFLQLETFERFVFVISVLEGYTVRECGALLDASPREVEQVRVRAMQKIAGDNKNILPTLYVNNSQREASSIFQAR